MRITGGNSRGRLLASVKGLNIRPTSSKVREAIFNLLGNDVTGKSVLDLFAGTGCLGIEALSRGALLAFFIDNSHQSISLIKKNLVRCGFETSGFVLKQNILKGIVADGRLRDKSIDLAFIDPPYGRNIIVPVLKDLSKKEILSPKAILVVESSRSDELPEKINRLYLFDTRIYGETKITIYHYKEILNE